MSNLDGFVKYSRPPPRPLATSQEVRDRGSTFVAVVYAANSPEAARKAVNHLKHIAHGSRPATHEMAAWRCMALQSGKSGLGGPDDFEVISGSDDDGEKYGGVKVLKVMQTESVIDAVVIVSRWFGGEMLGPARFDHIETCAREVCRTFRLKDDMATCIATLTSLDDILASLRAELASLNPLLDRESKTRSDEVSVAKKPPNSYAALEESLDLAKAKRLVNARENSIKSVKLAISNSKARMDKISNPLVVAPPVDQP